MSSYIVECPELETKDDGGRFHILAGHGCKHPEEAVSKLVMKIRATVKEPDGDARRFWFRAVPPATEIDLSGNHVFKFIAFQEAGALLLETLLCIHFTVYSLDIFTNYARAID